MTVTTDVAQGAEPQCPECGTPVTGGGRYVAWCAACEWNVDPEVRDEESPGRIERMRRGLARRYGEQLFDELGAADRDGDRDRDTGSDGHDGGDGDGGRTDGAAAGRRPRRGAAGALATALALTVHGVTLAMLAVGVWLVVAGWGTSALPVLGGFLLLVAFVLRPRFDSLAKVEDRLPVLRRDDAPKLFALLDEVAASAGTTGVRAVVIDADTNASVSAYGIRQHRVLHLGLGLWQTLSPQERIALLGHEFGHYAHGDTRHSLVVGNAFRSLSTWRYALASEPADSLMGHFVNLVTALPRLLVEGVVVLLDQLTLRGSQRAEYLADSTAARAAGTEAAAGLMDRLLVSDGVTGELRREAVAARTRIGGARRDDPAEGLWERLAAHAASVPEHEYERLRRVAERRGHSVDSTHPPTHLRHRRLTGGERREALIVLDAPRAAEVDAELADARRVIAREVVRG
ncbi:M48 family metallopeptidase [Streptomyces sp. NPDC056169]|uniref:M48 family metallopeptidase n=1 Tax=Streptomyces sp. NPDC056169 TaxID=3345734 RepID=UPI0035D8F6C7